MSKRILVLDPSTSHLAFTYIVIEGDVATVEKAGMLWTMPKWPMAQKLDYMYDQLELLIAEDIQEFHTEGYFVHFSRPSGISAIPTINNLFRMLVWKKLTEDLVKEIPPTKWRKTLGIKPTMINGKRDYKVPTADVVVSMIGPIPEKIISNITGKERTLPHDITDALAIGLSVAKDNGCKKFKLEKGAFTK